MTGQAGRPLAVCRCFDACGNRAPRRGRPGSGQGSRACWNPDVWFGRRGVVARRLDVNGGVARSEGTRFRCPPRGQGSVVARTAISLHTIGSVEIVRQQISWHVPVADRAQEAADRQGPDRGRAEIGRGRLWPAVHHGIGDLDTGREAVGEHPASLALEHRHQRAARTLPRQESRCRAIPCRWWRTGTALHCAGRRSRSAVPGSP